MKPRTLLRITRWLAAALLLFVAASVGFAMLFTGAHQREVGAPPADFPYAIEDVSFTTADSVAIRGWYIPSETGATAVVLLHGYTDNRASMLERARMLREAGYGTLLYDARGCGESGGDMISMGYYETEDLLASIAWLRGKGVRDIACLGASQGGATIALAADRLRDVRCVICESTYDSMHNAVDRRFRNYIGIPGWLGACLMVPIAEMRLGCSTADIAPVTTIGRLSAPVYIIGGEEDTRAWAEDVRRLYAAAPEPKRLWMIPGADHEDLYRFAPEEYKARVLGFLREYMPPR